jgi:hypothetical protein
MQIQLRFLILLLGLTSIYCSREKDKNSKVWTRKTFYENGALKGEMEIIDTIPNGKVIEYYPNGKIEFTMYFTDGKPHGPYEYFYESGVLMTKQYNLQDKRHSGRIDYYESGNIRFQGKFFNGHPVGEHITYFNDNRKKIKQIIDYILFDTNHQINTHVIYDSSGTIIEQTPLVKVEEENGKLKVSVFDKEFKPTALVLGQFDKYYVIGRENLESLDTIYFKDNLFVTIPYQKGDTLRGVIDNYKPVNSDSGLHWNIWFTYPKQWN